jgi:hypothetical protein
MIEYHKIQSVYKRDEKTKRFIEGEWSTPEFQYLKNNIWIWTEKIDGTNIRIGWDGSKIEIGGRTNDASIPTFLLKRLNELFTNDLMASVFGTEPTNVVLFGEGYGNKIQKVGCLYNPTGVDCILFDVWIGMYLERHNVIDIAGRLGIDTVPIFGDGPLLTAIEYMKSSQAGSRIGNAKLEGLVLRPLTELRTRRRERVITKIKYQDFRV